MVFQSPAAASATRGRNSAAPVRTGPDRCGNRQNARHIAWGDCDQSLQEPSTAEKTSASIPGETIMKPNEKLDDVLEHVMKSNPQREMEAARTRILFRLRSEGI